LGRGRLMRPECTRPFGAKEKVKAALALPGARRVAIWPKSSCSVFRVPTTNFLSFEHVCFDACSVRCLASGDVRGHQDAYNQAKRNR